MDVASAETTTYKRISLATTFAEMVALFIKVLIKKAMILKSRKSFSCPLCSWTIQAQPPIKSLRMFQLLRLLKRPLSWPSLVKLQSLCLRSLSHSSLRAFIQTRGEILKKLLLKLPFRSSTLLKRK